MKNNRTAAEGKDYESGIAIEAKQFTKKTVKTMMAVKQKKDKFLPK